MPGGDGGGGPGRRGGAGAAGGGAGNTVGHALLRGKRKGWVMLLDEAHTCVCLYWACLVRHKPNAEQPPLLTGRDGSRHDGADSSCITEKNQD